MPRLAILFPILLACQGVAFAQTTVLAEDFSLATFPPNGWSESRMGPNQSGWQRDTFGQRAWHEDFNGGTTENRLISPNFSLASLQHAYLHFENQTNYATYLANHPQSTGDGVSQMQLSLDGGLSWITVWNDTTLVSNEVRDFTVDLTAFVGAPSVELGIYFWGTYAHESWVDNIRIDDTPIPVLTTMTNPANGHPYTLIGASSRGDAMAFAHSVGGELLSIEDAQESQWVVQNLVLFGGQPREVWLGLSDAEIEGQWRWDTGEPLAYQQWALGEPNNGFGGNEDLAVLMSSGEWKDVDEAFSAFGIVEVSGPRLEYSQLVAGQLATFGVRGMREGSQVVFLFSTTGAGPMPSPFGPLEVDPNPLMTPAFPARLGRFDFSSYLPLGLAGSTLFSQAVELFAAGGGEITDALVMPIQ